MNISKIKSSHNRLLASSVAESNKAAFEAIRDRIVAELNGVATPDMIVTSLEPQPADSTAMAPKNE
ncbi:MAG: hypothetical protein IKL12_04140 [Alistipes sp.]|nr:hypothetical protein [Alistipes sp.]